MYVYICMYIYVCVYRIHFYIVTYFFAYMYIQIRCANWRIASKPHTHKHAHTHTCTYTHTYMALSLTHIRAYVYICIYVLIYMCIYIFRSTARTGRWPEGHHLQGSRRRCRGGTGVSTWHSRVAKTRRIC